MTAHESISAISRWDAAEELVEVLAAAGGAAVERIVSRGHTTDWSDQAHDEWVLVYEGSAEVAFQEGSSVQLGPGDHVLIPAHCVHRVVWTDPNVNTIWVAVHLPSPP